MYMKADSFAERALINLTHLTITGISKGGPDSGGDCYTLNLKENVGEYKQNTP